MKNFNFLRNLFSPAAGWQSNVVGSRLEEATIEQPLSTYSAPFGTCWQPSGKLHSVVRCAAMLVMLFTIGSGNAWGATYTITFATASSDPSGAISTSTAINTIISDGASYVKSLNTCTKCYGPAISGLKLGTSSATGTFKFTLSDDLAAKTIKSVTIKNVKYGSDSGNITGTATGTNTGSLGSATKGTDLVKDYTASSTTKITTIQVATSSKRAYISQIIIETIESTPTPTVTVSPASVTFAANTLSGGEASGSSTIDFSVTNGSQSSGQYLCAWPESDDANCEFTINNGDYSYCSGSATSVDDLSIEYYAIAAGTFTGRIYVNGYKANGDPVEETIELSVTISAPACANNVTINKGTETNCTFTLSTSGSQPSCSGVSTTVTVAPNSGYGNPSVTQSGASAAPAISGSSNTWTVAYGANTTGTSTINVSCSANNYTITLNTDLTPTSAGTTSITATYNANTNLTSAITKPTKTGWTFGGYYTAKNGGGTQIIDASGNVIASVSGYTDASKNWKYAGNITLYAKWTCTVTWSVNGLTNVYSTQTVTYNSSGSKVASVPTPDPASYCGDIFAGWSQKNAGSESKTTSYYDDLFTTVGGSPDIKSIGDITFYAVFADED